MRRYLVLAAVLLAACGGPAPAPEPGAAAPALEILEPRVHVLPGGMGVAYFSVRSTGSGDRLTAVETAAARAAEIHETVEDGGVMRMLPRLEGLEVPAGGTLELAPGGKHVMLVETRVPEGAASIRLTLRFERAGDIEVEAPITAMDDMATDGMEH